MKLLTKSSDSVSRVVISGSNLYCVVENEIRKCDPEGIVQKVFEVKKPKISKIKVWGEHLYGYYNREMIIQWNLNGQIEATFQAKNLLEMLFHNDRVYALCYGCEFYGWAKDGNQPVCFKGHLNLINKISFHGEHIYSVSKDYAIRKWDSKGNCLKIFGTNHMSPFQEDNIYYYMEDMVIYGNRIYGISINGIASWDLDGENRMFAKHEHIWKLSQHGKHVIFSYDNSNLIRAYDLENDKWIDFEGHNYYVSYVVIYRDHVYCTGYDGIIYVYDLNGKFAAKLIGANEKIKKIFVHRDLIYGIGAQSNMYLWKSSGECIVRKEMHYSSTEIYEADQKVMICNYGCGLRVYLENYTFHPKNLPYFKDHEKKIYIYMREFLYELGLLDLAPQILGYVWKF